MFIITEYSAVNVSTITSVKVKSQFIKPFVNEYFVTAASSGGKGTVLGYFKSEREAKSCYNRIVNGIINRADYIDLRKGG